MGALYATFPVLVLSDLPEGDTDHLYMESGWCTCELMVAMLGKTVHQYTSEQLSGIARTTHIALSMGNMDESAADEFEEQTRLEIEQKHFLHESDRKVALGIVNGYKAKRILGDAIERKDMAVSPPLCIRTGWVSWMGLGGHRFGYGGFGFG